MDFGTTKIILPHFLICYEESPSCKKILDYLRILFEGFQIEITFFHVITIPQALLFPQRDYLKEVKREEEFEKFCEEAKLKIQECFEKAVKYLSQRVEVIPHFTVNFTDRDRATSILQFLENKNFTAVLTGKRGLGRLASLWTGSLTQKLILYSDKPLWIIRGKDFNPRLLCAIDCGESGLRVIRYVIEILSFLKNYEVTFLHVLPFFGKSFLWEGSLKDLCNAPLPEEKLQFFKKVEPLFQGKELNLEKICFKITTSFLGPVYKILKEVKKGEYKTIIFGKRGEGGFKGLLLGSVATKLVNTLEDRAIWLIP
ncbi:MAG: universal stress protein [Caldimicrobium sp.]